MDELDDRHTDWIYICFYNYGSWGRGGEDRDPVKLAKADQYFITDRSQAVLSSWYFLLIVIYCFTF